MNKRGIPFNVIEKFKEIRDTTNICIVQINGILKKASINMCVRQECCTLPTQFNWYLDNAIQ